MRRPLRNGHPLIWPTSYTSLSQVARLTKTYKSGIQTSRNGTTSSSKWSTSWNLHSKLPFVIFTVILKIKSFLNYMIVSSPSKQMLRWQMVPVLTVLSKRSWSTRSNNTCIMPISPSIMLQFVKNYNIKLVYTTNMNNFFSHLKWSCSETSNQWTLKKNSVQISR